MLSVLRLIGVGVVMTGLCACTAPATQNPAAESPPTLDTRHARLPEDASLALEPEPEPRKLLPALPDPLPERPTRLGKLGDASLIETSGLAASLQDDRLIWAINDSGQAPELAAIDLTGASRGRWPLAAKNIDWEDLDSGYLHGEPMLVIADTGNNRRRRPRARLWLVPEPDVSSTPGNTTALIATEIWFTYEDGPHDVEAMALADDSIWFLSKEPLTSAGQTPARVYRLDLSAIDTANKERPVAQHVATLKIPPADFVSRLAASLASIDLNQPTALDIDEARGVAWVLTYRQVRRFERVGEEAWSTTLAREPVATYTHGLDQAEALAVTNSGLVVFTSEGSAAPLDALPPNWGATGRDAE